MASVLTGLIVTIAVSLAKPDNFDWSITRDINAPSSLYGDAAPGPKAGATMTTAATSTTAGSHGIAPVESHADEQEPKDPNHNRNLPTVIDEEKEEAEDAAVLENPQSLQRTFMMALILSTVLSLTMDVIIPLPLFFSHYIYSKGFFTFYIVISFLWVFAAFGLCGILPVWETRTFWREFFGEVFMGRKKVVAGVDPDAAKTASENSDSGTVTPAVHQGEKQEIKG
ncbi:hypothetical protein DL546_002433 [Coniochaeta pulveracea]|uniref:Uncharacterized protein n=1 Tax=Coniochaeta pulveracea TaxID=177199 RepID=A0A420Y0U6_9PEZI|nr:hypothetical protein DL546_002433 [Coniochaeta pulveracea]